MTSAWISTRCLGLLLGAVLFVEVAAGQTTGHLTGQITNADGQGLVSCGVALRHTTWQAIADGQGHFRLASVPAATYTLLVTCDGYRPQLIEEVTIYDGRAVVINPVMEVGFEEAVVDIASRVWAARAGMGALNGWQAAQGPTYPVRGVAATAALAAGVSSREGSTALHLRGGRADHTAFFLDGMRLTGEVDLPQAALRALEVRPGDQPI